MMNSVQSTTSTLWKLTCKHISPFVKNLSSKSITEHNGKTQRCSANINRIRKMVELEWIESLSQSNDWHQLQNTMSIQRNMEDEQRQIYPMVMTSNSRPAGQSAKAMVLVVLSSSCQRMQTSRCWMQNKHEASKLIEAFYFHIFCLLPLNCIWYTKTKLHSSLCTPVWQTVDWWVFE